MLAGEMEHGVERREPPPPRRAARTDSLAAACEQASMVLARVQPPRAGRRALAHRSIHRDAPAVVTGEN